MTSTEELVEVFNDHFSNVGPKLVETIPISDNDASFRDFITQQTGSSFSLRPVSVTLVYNLLKKLSIIIIMIYYRSFPHVSHNGEQ